MAAAVLCTRSARPRLRCLRVLALPALLAAHERTLATVHHEVASQHTNMCELANNGLPKKTTQTHMHTKSAPAAAAVSAERKTHRVGVADFIEFLPRAGRVVHVRMVLSGKLPEGGLQLRLIGVPVHPEDLVEIPSHPQHSRGPRPCSRRCPSRGCATCRAASGREWAVDTADRAAAASVLRVTAARSNA